MVAGTAGVLVLTLVSRPDAPGQDSTGDRSAAEGTPADAPRTIPAVRSWEPERGPGWRPRDSTRVVADPEGPLADEARLLAEELDVSYVTGEARSGDVELVLRDEDEVGEHGPEGYVLTTREDRVTIAGSDDSGVFYGTRTLLQALADGDRLPEGVVEDWPARDQRGMLLDIARKHYSAQWIEDRIRELADLKLNQLQLHLSDDQAFRVESDSHPEVVSEPHLDKEQLRDIVELAESRHITVIPEIDSPGHLGAVIAAHPDLQLRNAAGVAAPGAVDITDPQAAEIVDDLLREYADLFPGEYLHLGGDEYRALTAENPEASYPQLAQAARRRYGADARVQDLVTAWLNDRAEVVRELGRTPQVWNDGMHPGGVVRPDRDRQVTYWTGREIGARQPDEYLEQGWPLINFNDEYLYYVLGEPNRFRYPTGERIYRQWTPAILRGTEPAPESLTGPDQVLGGRFAVWGDIADAQTPEEVADGIRLPLRALAQKVWDPRPPEPSWKEFRALAGRLD